MIDLSLLSPYELGIIWALGTHTDGKFVLRYKDKYYLKKIAEHVPNIIYAQRREGNIDEIQYVIKSYLIDLQQLQSMGWDNRVDNNRSIPPLNDYKDFLRAYIEIHSCIDERQAKSRGKYYNITRLRIYGGLTIINQINEILSAEAVVAIKKVQTLNNKKTAALYYQSAAEITKILTYINGNPKHDKFWGNELIKQLVKESI